MVSIGTLIRKNPRTHKPTNKNNTMKTPLKQIAITSLFALSIGMIATSCHTSPFPTKTIHFSNTHLHH